MRPLSTSTESSRRVRRRRGPLALVAAALILALPAIAIASHQFSDVPTSSPFHTNIARLVGSGITAGCGSGRFCPKATVTREQMAAFMSRGLGRAALGTGTISMADAADFYVGTVRIAIGGASGGTGFATVSADVNAVTDVPGLCPCRGSAFLVDLATGARSNTSVITLADDGFGDNIWSDNGVVSWVFAAPSNQARTYGLAVDLETTGVAPRVTGGSIQGGPTGTNAFLFTTLTAEYSPFGSTGGSTLESVDVNGVHLRRFRGE